MSTPIGKSIITRKVYHNDIVNVCDHNTLADLVELHMEDFDVIMGMDYLSSFYATVDFRTKIVHLAVLEWKGNIRVPRVKSFYYIKSKR